MQTEYPTIAIELHENMCFLCRRIGIYIQADLYALHCVGAQIVFCYNTSHSASFGRFTNGLRKYEIFTDYGTQQNR